jgi:DNA-binding NarL/FixJ family response regulator
VKNQASSLFGKLGVRDRTRAVLRAIELGVLC